MMSMWYENSTERDRKRDKIVGRIMYEIKAISPDTKSMLNHDKF